MNRETFGILACVVVLAFSPVASVSADLVDIFDRADAADLGPNWTQAFGNPQLSISSGMAAPDNLAAFRGSAFIGGIASAEDDVVASIEFRACNFAENAGSPTLVFGINNTSGAGGTLHGGTEDFLYIQGTLGVKLWANLDWRDTSSTFSTPLTVGDWYKATVEQHGTTLTGTVSELDGTVLMQHVYEQPDATSTGTAFVQYGSWGGGYQSSAAFDNFTITGVVPEPGTLVLVATGLLGLLCYAWRKRK